MKLFPSIKETSFIKNEGILNLLIGFLRRKIMPLRKSQSLQFEYGLFNELVEKPIIEKPLWCYFVKRGTCIIPLETYKKSTMTDSHIMKKYTEESISPMVRPNKKYSIIDIPEFGNVLTDPISHNKESNLQEKLFGLEKTFFSSYSEICKKIDDHQDLDASEYILMNSEFGSSVWELRPQTKLKVLLYKEIQDEVIEPRVQYHKVNSPGNKPKLLKSFDSLIEAQGTIENNEETVSRARAYTFSQLTNYDDYESKCNYQQFPDQNESRFFLHSFSSAKAKTTLDQVLKPKLDSLIFIPII